MPTGSITAGYGGGAGATTAARVRPHRRGRRPRQHRQTTTVCRRRRLRREALARLYRGAGGGGKGRSIRRQQLHGRRCRRRGRGIIFLAALRSISAARSRPTVSPTARRPASASKQHRHDVGALHSTKRTCRRLRAGRVAIYKNSFLGHPHQQPAYKPYSLGTYLTATPTFTSTPIVINPDAYATAATAT